MKYRMLVFDFDGTLADSGDWFVETLNAMADELKFKKLDKTKSSEFRGLGPIEFLKYLGVPAYKMPRIVARIRSEAARDSARIKLFPGVVQTLAQLKAKGFILAVVSSNAAAGIRKTLGESVASQFDHFNCGASLLGKHIKLNALLRRAQVAPSEAIYIGDEQRDATAARAVGMAFGAVAWGYADPEALRARSPEHFFESVESLLQLRHAEL